MVLRLVYESYGYSQTRRVYPNTGVRTILGLGLKILEKKKFGEQMVLRLVYVRYGISQREFNLTLE